MAADVLHNQKMIHIICLASAAVLMFLLRYVKSFELMCVMVFIANFQTQPTWSLLDQTAMAFLTRVGGDYGKQRLYGAIGYGTGGYFAGVLAAAVGIAWCFNMVLALSLISLFLLIKYIPSFEAEISYEHELQSTKETGSFLTHIGAIFRRRDVLVLFVIVLLVGIMGGMIDSFLFLYLYNLSNDDTNLIGIIIAIETISELPLFFYSNEIITYFGTPKCVFFGLMAYGIRIIVYIFVENPWKILPVEALHGVTFGLLWAALTNYVYQSSTKGTEGTMIGLLTAVQKGMGSGLGTLVGGYIYNTYGGSTMWKLTSCTILPLSFVFASIFPFVAENYSGGSPARKAGEQEIALVKTTSFEKPSAAYGAISTMESGVALK